MARARQQEAVESAFSFVETRGLAVSLPDDVRENALRTLLPLRHVAWGASMNNDFIAAYGHGTGITQPALYYAMDQLGIAQFITRMGLLLAEPDALDVAKREWMESNRWQSLRRVVEDLFVQKDWFELFVAQDVVLDGLLYPLVYGTIVDDALTMRGGSAVAMVSQFQSDWFAEAAKWVDAQIKAACAENGENRSLVAAWVGKWMPRIASALLPIAEIALGDHAGAAVEEAVGRLERRVAKAGLGA